MSKDKIQLKPSQIEKIENKINKFSEILQNFGLDLIQTIGGLKHDVGILSNKIENIDKSIIELKGIKTQLHETIKIQREWQKEISDIKALIRSINQKYGVNQISQNEASVNYSKINETPLDVLEKFKDNVANAKDVASIYSAIKNTKERIFILTGGHKILFELRAYEQKAKRDSNIHFTSFKETILQKINEWKSSV